MKPILVVDDQAENLALLQRFLEKAEYPIQLAQSGAEALALLADNGQASPPGLILLDIFMPDLSGLETLQAIKAMPHHTDTPVIMVTASDDISLLTQAFTLGAADYIEKPIRREELLARVRSALRLTDEIMERKHSQAELAATAQRLEQANTTLQELALFDGLTGIPNRRRFDELLSGEWLAALREQDDLAVGLFDIDFFKNYNDNLGHVQGDACLKAVAESLQASLNRPRDFVGRYGGEEFVVLLPKTGSAQAWVVAERMRCSVEALGLQHPDSAISARVTVSGGVASLVPASSQTPSELVAYADQALYQAKQTGRNHVVTYTS